MKEVSRFLAMGMIAGVMFGAAPFNANAEKMSDEEFGERVKEYLFNNPEVILEAVARADDIKAKLEANKNRAMIADFSDEIFHDSNAPEIGNKAGDITIVEFFDYNCGACRMMYRAFEVVMLQDKNIRVVFKELPIFGEESERIHSLSLALNKVLPGKYAEFHTRMMKYNGKVTEGITKNIIRQSGVSDDEYQKIVEVANSQDIRNMLLANKKLGSKMQLKGTPALVINDELVPHALDMGDLQLKIEKHREKLKEQAQK